MSAWIPVCINLEHFIVFTFSGEERESFIAGTPYLYKEVCLTKIGWENCVWESQVPFPVPGGPGVYLRYSGRSPSSQAPSATPQTPLLQHIS